MHYKRNAITDQLRIPVNSTLSTDEKNNYWPKRCPPWPTNEADAPILLFQIKNYFTTLGPLRYGYWTWHTILTAVCIWHQIPPKHSHPSGLLYHHDDGRTTFVRKRRRAPKRLYAVTIRKTIFKRGFTRSIPTRVSTLKKPDVPLLQGSVLLASKGFNAWRDIQWLSLNASISSTRDHTASERKRVAPIRLTLPSRRRTYHVSTITSTSP